MYFCVYNMSIIYSFISCYLLTTAWVLLWLYSTSRRKILLILSGLRALKRKLKGKEELGEMMPWSCGTVNSSPNSSTPCNLQDTGRAVLLYIIMLRLSLLGRIKKVGWRERNPKLSTVAYLDFMKLLSFEKILHVFFFQIHFWICKLSNSYPCSLNYCGICWYLCSKILSKCKCLLSNSNSGRTPQHESSMTTSSGLSLIWQIKPSFICPTFVGYDQSVNSL